MLMALNSDLDACVAERFSASWRCSSLTIKHVGCVDVDVCTYHWEPRRVAFRLKAAPVNPLMPVDTFMS